MDDGTEPRPPRVPRMSEVFSTISAIGVVPVVEIDRATDAVPLARALLAGGIPTMEVTFRTDAAAEAIRLVAAEVPGFFVGAGTLMTSDDIDRAVAAGASYGVSPGFRSALSATAAAASFPFIPGAITPGEILDAIAAGHHHLKFFPAEQYGGLDTLRSLAAPFSRLGISFMPTGGVRARTLGEYLGLSNVFAVGGTWIASRTAIAEGRFDDIEAAARDARTIVDTL
jgi:2-dehydro-3-deoxyphosphogluconate aldolase / (4S)-4-hydroxy-2-oxoglutarate aldolase